MFGLAFSNAFTAASVATPSPPRPWVANTMVCLAVGDTCPAVGEFGLLLLLQPATAKANTAANASVPRAPRNADPVVSFFLIIGHLSSTDTVPALSRTYLLCIRVIHMC